MSPVPCERGDCPGLETAQAARLRCNTFVGRLGCSPAFSDVNGPVTINCHGVDPRALARLNELLDKKDVELQEKIREAEDWAQQYQELKERLTVEGRDSQLARQAETFLKAGELEKAGALLDRLLREGEQEVERIASHQYSRAQVYSLQFKPLEALHHYRKAYQYYPEQAEYAHAYAIALHKQNQYDDAEPLYQEALRNYRQLDEANSTAYLRELAMTLNNLGLVYGDTQRHDEAEAAFQEALRTFRQFAGANPVAYLPDVASILNNLGALYVDTQRLKEAERAFRDVQEANRLLAADNPTAYLIFRPWPAPSII